MAKLLVFVSLIATTLFVKGALPSVRVSDSGSGVQVSTVGAQPDWGQSSPGSGTNSGLENTTANWSGYAATGGRYTAVSGAWTVPQVTASNPDSADAAWVGIGGMGSTDLIQVGTQDQVNSDGSEQSAAFYELLPNSETTIPGVSVSPGDRIQASLNEDATGLWTIRLSDTTTGQSFATQTYYSSANSSVEWIEEDPGDGYGQVPLDNFGNVTFTNAGTSTAGSSENLSQAGAVAYTMANQAGQALVSVSAITNGIGFSVTRTQANQTGGGSPDSRWYRHGEGIGRWQHQTVTPYGNQGQGYYPPTAAHKWWRAFGF